MTGYHTELGALCHKNDILVSCKVALGQTEGAMGLAIYAYSTYFHKLMLFF